MNQPLDSNPTISISPSSDQIPSGHIHPNNFYDEQLFSKGIKIPELSPEIASPVGLIIPHHTLPSHLISQNMQLLAPRPPSRIIIIGPNHFETGRSKFLTSTGSWETPFGFVHPDIPVIQQLVASGLLVDDPGALDGEHSIGAIMPYLKYYVPEVQVIPIVLSAYISLDEISSLRDTLAPHLNESTTVIAAVDFAHYLTSEQSNINDSHTLSLIESSNYSELITLSSDYTDSPGSLILFDQLMNTVPEVQHTVTGHTNASDLLNKPTGENTSYFSIVYHSN